MPLHPDEIQNKEFDQAMRGYDKDQVRAFLETVASEHRDLQQAGNYEAVGAEVGRILQTVNDSAAALRAKADAEAEEILSKAETEAREMRDGAQGEVTKLKEAAEAEAQRLRDEANREVKELVQNAQRRAEELEATVRRETEEQTRDANQRLDTLRQAERDLRGRLDRAKAMLSSITDQLDEGIRGSNGSPPTESVALQDEGEPAKA